MLPQPSLAFLIADRQRARILVRHGDGRYAEIASFENEPAHRPQADTRGRIFAGGPDGRRSAAPEAQAASYAPFAEVLATAVAALSARGTLDRIVLVAPARMIAPLRTRLAGKVAIGGEHPKDLTKLPERALHEILDGLALRPAPVDAL